MNIIAYNFLLFLEAGKFKTNYSPNQSANCYSRMCILILFRSIVPVAFLSRIDNIWIKVNKKLSNIAITVARSTRAFILGEIAIFNGC